MTRVNVTCSISRSSWRLGPARRLHSRPSAGSSIRIQNATTKPKPMATKLLATPVPIEMAPDAPWLKKSVAHVPTAASTSLMPWRTLSFSNRLA